MASLQQACPLPLHPYPKKTGNGDHKTRKNTLSGYIFILQDDYLKVTFLNCLTGLGRNGNSKRSQSCAHVLSCAH